MNPHILEIFQRTHRAGPALFPPGDLILQALRWDSYCNYYELHSHHNYYYSLLVSMIGAGEDVIRVKQIINVEGVGLHRKHEAAFAFALGSLADVSLVDPRNNPRLQNMRLPNVRGASYHEPGEPTAIQLSFVSPVQVRRWSCMPITAGVIDQEISLFDISLWFTSSSVANFAREKLLLAREEWLASPLSDSRLSTGFVIPAPQFGDIPSAPPGGIDRGF